MPSVINAVAQTSLSLCDSLLQQIKKRVEIQISDEDDTVSFHMGSPLIFGTPSYWIAQHYLHIQNDMEPRFTIGANLYEETAACILGGYGIPAEVGLEAFTTLRKQGLIQMGSLATEQELLSALIRPLFINGKPIHYRFPHQKAQRLASASQYFANHYDPELTPIELREWLLNIPGIGPKTASWIVRNQTGSNDVAIIDIHIQRAGIKAGFFLPNWTPARHYFKMEQAFLAFAQAISIPAAQLDVLIWAQMRTRAAV